jgi:hypothetical protein
MLAEYATRQRIEKYISVRKVRTLPEAIQEQGSG